MHKILVAILTGLFPLLTFAQLSISGQQKISDSVGYINGFMNASSFYRFGSSVVNLGDMDNDGRYEIFVGGEGDNDGGTERGSVWLMDMNIDGTVHSAIKYSDPVISGLVDFNKFGWSIDKADIDNDGILDMIVSTDDEPGTGIQQGGVFIIFLNADASVKGQQKITTGTGGLSAVLDDGDHFGWNVAAIGDLNKDGFQDIVVGTPDDDDGGTDRGAVYILFLDNTGNVIAEQKISDLTGGLNEALDNSDRFGIAVEGLGDFDGDGWNDIAVGAEDNDGGPRTGAVYILFLDSTGTVTAEQKISQSSGGFNGILDSDDRFGGFEGDAIAVIGDINCDGVQDLAVGAQKADGSGTERGALHILLMNIDGTVDSTYRFTDIPGVLDQERFGSSVELIEDIDGNGVRDFAVGAVRDNDGGLFNGAIWILFMDKTRIQVDNNISFCPDDTLTVVASGATTYKWHIEGDTTTLDSDSAFTVSLQTSTNYIVKGEECLIDTVRFTLAPPENCYELFVYKLLTPNGDGKNEQFQIMNIDRFPENKVYVLNRLGEKVFETSGYNNSWSGGNLPDGTYFYVIEIDGLEKPLKGSLQIRR